ncbi:hypothetical protein E2C01_069386 [Portunus trituberculatus]|uniref:Uncharacterized protein n=1 Tax=Portunus trituberculatus TaxID=210409 RepID=A0A5B7HYE5_PORTR|nr:hypothetical protein [Portunus trituberculatus]
MTEYTKEEQAATDLLAITRSMVRIHVGKTRMVPHFSAVIKASMLQPRPQPQPQPQPCLVLAYFITKLKGLRNAKTH